MVERSAWDREATSSNLVTQTIDCMRNWWNRQTQGTFSESNFFTKESLKEIGKITPLILKRWHLMNKWENFTRQEIEKFLAGALGQETSYVNGI